MPADGSDHAALGIVGDGADLADGRRHLERGRKAGNDGVNLAEHHGQIHGADAHHGVAKGQDLFPVGVGQGSHRGRGHVPLHEGDTHRSARNQGLGRRRTRGNLLTGAAGADGMKTEGLQFLSKVGERGVRSARYRQRNRHGLQARGSRFRGSRPRGLLRCGLQRLRLVGIGRWPICALVLGQHGLDGGDTGQRLLGERPAIGDGTHQLALDVDRTAAHARGDPARFQARILGAH